MRRKSKWIFSGWTVEREDATYDNIDYQFVAYSDVDGLNFTVESLKDTIENLKELLSEYEDEQRK